MIFTKSPLMPIAFDPALSRFKRANPAYWRICGLFVCFKTKYDAWSKGTLHFSSFTSNDKLELNNGHLKCSRRNWTCNGSIGTSPLIIRICLKATWSTQINQHKTGGIATKCSFSTLTVLSFGVICGGARTSCRSAALVVLPVIIIVNVICPAAQVLLKVTVDVS